MNGRSGWFAFLLFLLILAVILLQVLSMIQSDRLYERLNVLLDAVSGQRQETTNKQESNLTAQPANKQPGDEGDWLVQHLGGEPRSLNPISVDYTMESIRVCERNIFETLFYYDLDFDGVKLKPVLAESLKVSDDGLEMTVKLKENIWFSDGTPITADDVVFTFETIMNPRIDVADLRGYYQNIKEVVKTDNKTVKFIFNELYWKTLESVGVFEVLPKHIYQFKDPNEFNKRISNPVGSGPYIFDRWDVGQQIILKRNENYWGKKPNMKKMVFKIITNSTAALQALRSHDIDYMEPRSEQFAEVSKDEQFKKEFNILSYWEPSGGYAYIGWNENTPYFKDSKVRLAMTHIINRKAIVEYLLKGNATVISGPFYLYGKQNDPNIKPWPYDPNYAKQLLKKAGWADTDKDGILDKNGIPFRFKFSYPAESQTGEGIAKLLKDDGAKVGIDVIADPVEWSIFIEKMNSGQFDACMSGWAGTIESDPYQLFHSSQMKDRGNNRVGFNNKEADALIEESRRTLDENKRYALYHKFHQLLHQEQPYTFLFSKPTFGFIDKRFENVNVHKLGVDTFEWYVPKEKQRYK
jgi:peptide/nickel transport system substrate-binding protein